MVELLVLADDFTGALDTGVQFARKSIPTLVSTRIETLDQGIDEEISVIVVDLETRHLPPAQAAVRVRRAVRKALGGGVNTFYKKTDSTLRGNIGSELAAVLEASEASTLAFVPAYPKNRRTTVAGHQYVDGVPLHRSPYAEDPQNPLRSSCVPEIIAAQSEISVEVVENAGGANPEWLDQEQRRNRRARILVFDARTDQDLRRIAGQLKRTGLIRLTAGCAGFAEQLPRALDLKTKEVRKLDCPAQLLIVCGSTNRVSLDQIEVAVRSGVRRVYLRPDQPAGWIEEEGKAGFDPSQLPRIGAILSSGSDLILQTAGGQEDIRRFREYAWKPGTRAEGSPGEDLPGRAVPHLVARALGELVFNLLDSQRRLTPVVFGGDTALAIVERLGSVRIIPVEEVTSGVVLSRVIGNPPDMPLITKAGGFGSPMVIQEIRRFVNGI